MGFFFGNKYEIIFYKIEFMLISKVIYLRDLMLICKIINFYCFKF